MSEENLPDDDNRRGERQDVEFEVVYISAREEGTGVLVSISKSGALLEDTSLKPKLGAEVQLNVILYGGDAPVQLRGQVTRYTKTGFAIEITRWYKPKGLE